MSDDGSDAAAHMRERVVARLDHMVEAGRITEDEAARLRASPQADDFEEGVRAIRVRHAAAKLREAVDAGQMTREEADGHLERLRDGEHPRSLRERLRSLPPRPL